MQQTERRPSVAWMDGELVDFRQATVPVEDRGLQFGESLYEVIAVTAGRPRLLEEHAARMRAGARELGLEAGSPDDETWAAMAEALIARDGIGDGLLYAQLTAGDAPRAHLLARPVRPRFFAYVRPYRFPRADDVAQGIGAVTCDDPRWARCDLKTTMLLPAVLAKRAAAANGAEEAIFIGPDGTVREGASSNVVLVEGGELVTPAQTRHLLPGLTRPFIGALAGEAGLAMRQERVDRARLAAAEELFVASTAALLMPIVALDDVPVGGGATGPVAADLARRLRVRWQLDD